MEGECEHGPQCLFCGDIFFEYDPPAWTWRDDLRTRWWLWAMREGTARRAILISLRRRGKDQPPPQR